MSLLFPTIVFSQDLTTDNLITNGTFDDGTTHTPTDAVIYSALPTQVFLTLGASMSADNTPKVALVGSVSDIAGNSTSTGSLANATDKIHPSVTATLSGGTGTDQLHLKVLLT